MWVGVAQALSSGKIELSQTFQHPSTETPHGRNAKAGRNPRPPKRGLLTWKDNPKHCNQKIEWIAAEPPFNCIKKKTPSVVSNSPAMSKVSFNYNTAGNTYAYGWCTWYAKSRAAWIPNELGNAVNWGYKFGYHSQPIVGSVAWTTAGWGGHVAYVEKVSGSMVYVSEMAYKGWDVVSYRWATIGSWTGFLY